MPLLTLFLRESGAKSKGDMVYTFGNSADTQAAHRVDPKVPIGIESLRPAVEAGEVCCGVET